MSELAADPAVSMPTHPAERRLGVLTGTDDAPPASAHTTTRIGGAEWQPFTLDAPEPGVRSRRRWERTVIPAGPGSSRTVRQAARRSGERWAPPIVAATKLIVPRSRRPLVPRPSLSARLNEDYRLALVSAPAGYGKTAALATWAADNRDRVAWFSCDRSDAEPTRFVSGLLQAIAARWPGVADDAFALMALDGADSCDVATAVANELATIDSPGAIVVDDLHLAAPDPALLIAFTDALPDGFRFVAATRSDPSLPLARLRLRGDLLELRGNDLRFDRAELSDFLTPYALVLTNDELVRLHELTEGWPAGVQSAAIALQGGSDPGERLQALIGTDGAVGDFVMSEILSGLSPELVGFLTQTSVIDVFDAGLCAEVTGIEDAGAVLEHLLTANLFVVPVDQEGRRYRFHRQFGAFLRTRLASSGTANLRATHDRACRALEDRGDDVGALQQAMAIPDAARAGRIVRAALGRTDSRPQSAALTIRAIHLWLQEYGAATIETDPAWVVELLIGLTVLSDTDDGLRWLERIRRAHPLADGELTALIEMARAEHHQQQGQPLQAIAHLRAAEEAIGRVRPGRGPLADLDVSIAIAHLQAGQAAEALASLDDDFVRPTGTPVADEVRRCGIAAFATALAGELTRAEQLATGVVHHANEDRLGRHGLGRTLADLGLVELHLDRHDHESAARILRQLTQAGDASHRPLVRSLITLHQAKLARLLGDQIGAEASLRQARRCYTEPDAAVRQTFGEEAVAQALQFDPSRAAQLIAELDQDHVATQILRARLALLDDDDRSARTLLAALPPATTLRTRVERNVLTALSVLAPDVERAGSLLRDALDAGQPEQLISTVVDQAPAVHHLLQTCTSAAGHHPYVDDLVAASRRIRPPARADVTFALVEPLSPREIAVLRYLCSRLTCREIASTLYVSVNTVKTHVRSIYRKLDVATRADAVAIGRSHGLLGSPSTSPSPTSAGVSRRTSDSPTG